MKVTHALVAEDVEISLKLTGTSSLPSGLDLTVVKVQCMLLGEKRLHSFKWVMDSAYYNSDYLEKLSFQIQ